MTGLAGMGKWGHSNLGFNIINGIRLPRYSLGIAFGGRFFGKKNPYDLTFTGLGTISFDGRYYFPHKKLTPYLGLGLGYVYGIKIEIWAGDTFYGNIFANTSAGICWEISKRVSLNAGIIYECYKIPYDPFYTARKSAKLSNTTGIALSFSFRGR